VYPRKIGAVPIVSIATNSGINESKNISKVIFSEDRLIVKCNLFN
jgi:hypothetical protein